jgi:carnitine-CoA ligase
VTAGTLELKLGERTVPRMLARAAGRAPERLWVRCGGVEVTYAAALNRAARFAGTLQRAGVGPGDRVAAMCGNGMALVDVLLGAAWLGAIAVPINVAARGAQLAHVLDDADPAVLVVDPPAIEHLQALPSPPPALAHVWVTAPAGASPTWGGLAIEPLPEPGEPRVEAHPVRPGDPFAILYTSGTTGPAKGVVCPHAQFYWWGLLTGRCLGVTAEDRLYTVLPLFHTNAINSLFQALLAGASIAVGARFSASRFWDEVRAADATVTYLLGAMVAILLRQRAAPGEHDHRLRIALAPATPAETSRAFSARFGVSTLLDGYGSTETNMVLANTIGGYWPGVMGFPLPEFEARAVDEDDAEVPPGTPGELVVRQREPYSFALGYHGLPEATLEAWRNLWFHTGDRVVRDPDGAFRFLDRLHDAIRRRGENVSSWEVEQALGSHPEVAAAAAVPVPSELGEDEVMAFVVLREGAEIGYEELVRWCEPRLAYFAVPRYLERVAALPLTENGKVRKVELRERGVGPQTWDRDAAGVSPSPR